MKAYGTQIQTFKRANRYKSCFLQLLQFSSERDSQGESYSNIENIRRGSLWPAWILRDTRCPYED